MQQLLAPQQGSSQSGSQSPAQGLSTLANSYMAGLLMSQQNQNNQPDLTNPATVALAQGALQGNNGPTNANAALMNSMQPAPSMSQVQSQQNPLGSGLFFLNQNQ